ncbi:MAG: hypothetical protein EBV23_12685, partial [Flavobacteriia bacterium]|nr:hypothetical protein [Flavobacteriia bacterium]
MMKTYKILLTTFLILMSISQFVFSQGIDTLATWELTGINVTTPPWGLSPLPAQNVSTSLTTSGWIRGMGVLFTAAGIATTGSPAGNAWGGNGWDAFTASGSNNLDSAIDRGDFVYITFIIASGARVNFTSIPNYNIRRSSAGPVAGQWQYRVGETGSFINLGSPVTWGMVTTGLGNLQAAIDLSSITALRNLSGGTSVTFRLVNLGATASSGTWYFNQLISGRDITFLGEVSLGLPFVSTRPVVQVSSNTAITGGEVHFEGNSAVTNRGVAFSTNSNPTVADSITSNGIGLGPFTSMLRNLNSGVPYFIRAYATNTLGTSYGPQILFTIRNGIFLDSINSCLGDTSSVTISHPTLTGVANASLRMTYNPDSLTYVGFNSLNPAFNGMTISGGNGSVLMDWNTSTNQTIAAGNMVNLRFRVNGNSNLDWDTTTIPCEFSDVNFNVVPQNYVSGSITQNTQR